MFEWLRTVVNRRAALSRAAADYSNFERDVRAAFVFLIEQHGFDRSSMTAIAHEQWITYVKPSVTVRVHRELGSGPFVTLVAPTPIERDQRCEFGLHELEQEKEKLGRYSRKPSAPSSQQESLAELAVALRGAGEDVLNGDFTILFDRHQRHLEAVSRNRDR